MGVGSPALIWLYHTPPMPVRRRSSGCIRRSANEHHRPAAPRSTSSGSCPPGRSRSSATSMRSTGPSTPTRKSSPTSPVVPVPLRHASPVACATCPQTPSSQQSLSHNAQTITGNTSTGSRHQSPVTAAVRRATAAVRATGPPSAINRITHRHPGRSVSSGRWEPGVRIELTTSSLQVKCSTD